MSAPEMKDDNHEVLYVHNLRGVNHSFDKLTAHGAR